MANFRFSSNYKASKDDPGRVLETMNGVSAGMGIIEKSTAATEEEINEVIGMQVGTRQEVNEESMGNVDYYRPFTSNVFSSSKLPPKFMDEWKNRIASGGTENGIFKEFLEGKREIKPGEVAKDFIKMVGTVFKRALKKDEKITVVSFRHGDKNPDGTLSEQGKNQSQELGKKLKEELHNEGDNDGETILVATHNVFNETLINYIFSDVEDVEIPEERKNLLNFTETVKYTFYPNKEELDKSYLVVDWRGFKRQISYKEFYEKFKEILEGKEDKEAVENSD